MNKYAISLTMAAGFLTSSAAFATDYNCEGCNLGQMTSKALSFGKGEHRIYSFSTNLAYRFSVTCSGNVPLGSTPTPQSDSASGEVTATDSAPYEPIEAENSDRNTSAIDDQSVDAAGSGCAFNRPLEVQTSPLYANEQNAFNLMRAFLIAHPVGAGARGSDVSYDTGTKPGNSGYGDSAIQVLHDNTSYTELVDDIIDSRSGLAEFFSAATAGANASFNTGPNATFVLVTFRDGSSLIIRFDRNTHTNEIVPHSARNADNKAIIEDNQKGFEGTYYLSGGGISMGDYLDLLRRAGVPVVQASGVAKGFSCSWNDGTKTLTCTVIYM